MVTRILVEKKEGFNVEAISMKEDLIKTLGMTGLESFRMINCYDLEGIDETALDTVVHSVLSEPNVDTVSQGNLTLLEGEKAFRVEYLPGQFDQRADSAIQCSEIITLKEGTNIVSSKIIVLTGELSSQDMDKIKKYMINPVEASEVTMAIPETIKMSLEVPESVPTVEGFVDMDDTALAAYRDKIGFAMTFEDLQFVKAYFKDEEKRNPTLTELKVIDTYWSDHCRHTTFSTVLDHVTFEDNAYSAPIKEAYQAYQEDRAFVYADREKDMTLMDLATINTKILRKKGGLKDLDVSEEINACSLKVDIDVEGQQQPWLLMFKNETHNHPTEIEPFGGAATCLGGAIRDPLSGRSYVYHAMRVTGAADPTLSMSQTLEGKLPQKVITQKAAAGFSSYGNQIGLATGMVTEVYDPHFVAKRMEVGAVVGAAPAENVVRERPAEGDIILLVGGRTGRDGIGGATGSSKEHDEDSLASCGAEVQKGNAPVERKIQRLFRIPELSKMIKRCNDFGAGGVSVAIGELSESLHIDLDKVTKKYEGLDGTELAISESQERMAVVIAKGDQDAFENYCHSENLEVKKVAEVTGDGRLIMSWKGQEILNLSRAFLDTNGVKGHADVKVVAPSEASYFEEVKTLPTHQSLTDRWMAFYEDLNIASQKGLVERFDNTIGAGTVLMPFGGKFQQTPIQTMVAKFPVLGKETTSVSMMSYGYDPKIGQWSPFHGGYYAVVDSIAKIVATGGDYKKVRLSLQEYFEKLGKDASKWGKPFAALLGASAAQTAFETAAIGGKDSMSGTFKDINVPPTLIAFAVTTENINHIITPELKSAGHQLVWFKAVRDASEVVKIESLCRGYDKIHTLSQRQDICSAYAIGYGGIAMALSKMAFGNGIGAKLTMTDSKALFDANYGGMLLEVSPAVAETLVKEDDFELIGETLKEPVIQLDEIKIDLSKACEQWESKLNPIFPIQYEEKRSVKKHTYTGSGIRRSKVKVAKPKVFIPAFPGTNCEWDTARAFEKSGGEVIPFVFKNLSAEAVQNSIDEMVKGINEANIIAIPGGFSAGDEPEGSGKFIASAFRNPKVSKAVMALLNERDGLMIGICNGFQALIKLGLLPYGEIRSLDADSPTLTFNHIGRHVSKVTGVRVASHLSPWLQNTTVDDVYHTAFSHGEGRFYANAEWIEKLSQKGQIATQYVDLEGNVVSDGAFNINGSVDAIEGITSEDGRIFGKMGHIERIGDGLYQNIIGEKDMRIFEAGIRYFTHE